MATLLLGRKPLLPTEQKAGWVPQLVWYFWGYNFLYFLPQDWFVHYQFVLQNHCASLYAMDPAFLPLLRADFLVVGVSDCCWISGIFWKWCSFILGNIMKSQGAKSEEYGECETTVMLLASKDCCYFCSSVRNQGTNSMEIFHTLKSSLRINGMLHTECTHNMHNCWLAEKQHRE